MTVVLVGAFGFLLGLVAHDLAIQGLTTDRALRPLSGTCPNCGHNRGWTAWRCPECGRRISRELIIAATSALVAVGFANTLGIDWDLIPYLGFLTLSTALVVTDLEAFRIVDRLNLRGTVIVTVALAGIGLALGSSAAVLRSLLGAGAYFLGALLLYAAVRGRGFGGGDVKLAFQLGLFAAFVSWGTLGWAVFATAIIGGVLSVGLLAVGAARRDTELPYGPPMILGTWLAIVLAGVGAFPIPT